MSPGAGCDAPAAGSTMEDAIRPQRFFRIEYSWPLLVAAMAAPFAVTFADSADAASCQSLRRQMMMFQASREMGQWNRVRRLLESGNCEGAGAPATRARVREPAPSRPTVAPRPVRESRREPKPTARRSGTYRTLCVRSCDGYYFPISFSTSRERIEDDQAACDQACPGTEARIFYHRAISEGPERMVALDGTEYTSLPTAFSYRSKLDPSCSCGSNRSIEHILALTGTGRPPQAADDAPGSAPLPRPRQAPGVDPETLADRAGDFRPQYLSPATAAGLEVADAGIRQVGPGEPSPVTTSPVPNDFDTSLLWADAPGESPRKRDAAPAADATTGSVLR